MVGIVERRMIVPNVHVLTVEAPDVARSGPAGQFVIVHPTDEGERIPLTIADQEREAGTVTSVFEQVGESTNRIARWRAQNFHPVAGPLGHPTEIGSVGTVACGWRRRRDRPSVYPIAGALTEAGNQVVSILGARSSYLLFWEDKMASVRAAHRLPGTGRGCKGRRDGACGGSSLREGIRRITSSPMAAPS